MSEFNHSDRNNSVHLSRDAKNLLEDVFKRRVMYTGKRVTYATLVEEALELLKRQQDKMDSIDGEVYE